jgi:sialic acid synthase SpsE
VIIGPLNLGEGCPSVLIAELGNAHNGDVARAIRLLDAAKESGAAAAKLQCYTPDELIALRGDGRPPAPWDHMTMRELYQRAITPREWFPALFDHAFQIGLPLFSSVFGLESLALLEALNCPMYKVSSFERNATVLRDAVKATGKPWIVSRPDHPDPDAPTLWCPPDYPQTNFGGIREIRARGFVGLSYHGTSTTIPDFAEWHGARIIEAHFQLDGEPSMLESNVSLTASQFKQLAAAFEDRPWKVAA